MSSPKTALIMAGGTGGHIFPGLAVAEELKARGWRVHWLGTPGSMESRIVPQHGLPLETIDFSGVRGKGVITLALLPLNLLRAFWQALAVVRRVRPDVVIGMGGYVTFPGGVMAVAAGKPLLLHEQNSVAGMANRVLASMADRIFTAFPGVFKKGHWVGNPLRAAFTQPARPSALPAAPGHSNCWWWAAAWARARSTTSCPRRWRCCPRRSAPRSYTRAAKV